MTEDWQTASSAAVRDGAAPEVHTRAAVDMWEYNDTDNMPRVLSLKILVSDPGVIPALKD